MKIFLKMYKRKLLCFENVMLLPLLFTIFSLKFENCDTLKIYDNLVNCYRNDSIQPWVGNTLQVLIELIRKIEDSNPTSLDIRQLSVALLHQLRLDGIQKSDAKETSDVVPYQSSGFMIQKYEILLKLISKVSFINFDDALQPYELCILHRLISSSVEPRKRGDEHRVCSKGYSDTGISFDIDQYPADRVLIFPEEQKSFIIPQKYSQCPIELGVIWAYKYNTFSPGIVIASIAAGLQPQSINVNNFIMKAPVNDNRNLEALELEYQEKMRKFVNLIKQETVDNKFSSNLAGDLAEVCVYQSPYYRNNVSVGSSGFWNDLEYSINHYLLEQNPLKYAMTDSELLGGIDGYFMAKHINQWVNQVQRMKLSQILEMYYSPNGIPSILIESNKKKRPNDDSSFLKDSVDDFIPEEAPFYNQDHYKNSACDRFKILNRIPKEKLKDETFNFANILQYSITGMIVERDVLRESCNAAVNKFFNRANILLSQNRNKCLAQKKPTIDLTLILDGTRSKSDTFKLISYITEIIDVSSYASSIAVIHGYSGEYLIQPTNSVVNAFFQLKNYHEPYPTSLSLFESLSSFIQFLGKTNQTEKNLVSLSKVIVIMSQTQSILENDFENVKKIIEKPFQTNLDLYFVFITNSAAPFQELMGHGLISPERYEIIETTEISPKSFSTNLMRYLRKIPKIIHIPTSQKTTVNVGDPFFRDESEQYVSRDHINIYRITSNELKMFSEFKIQFEGSGYGSFTVCKMIDNDLQCSSTQNQPNESISFAINNHCSTISGNLQCKPIDFKVELDSSNVKCTESTCRYPDDIRYYIRFEDIKCYDGSNSNSCQINSFLLIILVVILSFFNV